MPGTNLVFFHLTSEKTKKARQGFIGNPAKINIYDRRIIRKLLAKLKSDLRAQRAKKIAVS